VRVRAAAYIGEPVGDVESALADKGLETDTNEVDNSGDHEAGTVADLSPTGRVEKGSTITLDVWGDPPSDEGDKPEPEKKKPEKTKEPKPEKTKEPKPEKTVLPDNSGNGGGGGSDTSSPAPNGRATSTPAEGGPVATPGTDAKGD